jgi:hypothetical protein
MMAPTKMMAMTTMAMPTTTVLTGENTMGGEKEKGKLDLPSIWERPAHQVREGVVEWSVESAQRLLVLRRHGVAFVRAGIAFVNDFLGIVLHHTRPSVSPNISVKQF